MGGSFATLHTASSKSCCSSPSHNPKHWICTTMRRRFRIIATVVEDDIRTLTSCYKFVIISSRTPKSAIFSPLTQKSNRGVTLNALTMKKPLLYGEPMKDLGTSLWTYEAQWRNRLPEYASIAAILAEHLWMNVGYKSRISVLFCTSCQTVIETVLNSVIVHT